MRIFLILICGIALVSLAPEVHAGKHKDKKSGDSGKASKSTQKAQAKSADWTKPKGGGKAHGRNGWENPNNTPAQAAAKPADWTKPKGAGKPKPVNTWNNPSSVTYSKKEKNWSNVNKHDAWNPVKTGNDSNTVKYSNKGKNWSSVEKLTTSSNGQTYQYKYKSKVKTKHYDLSFKPNPNIQSVKFDKNYRIHGSENWKGERYAVFRNYDNEWHDRGWWHSRYKRIAFFSGGWYYWNASHWYPAWGYAPDAYYAYDGPIYAYNGLPPDQVIANVQAALQEQGYYRAEVNGWLGPVTRTALGNYQRDHQLYMTSAIDRQTLQSLGME